MGVVRSTFVIDENGVIEKVYPKGEARYQRGGNFRISERTALMAEQTGKQAEQQGFAQYGLEDSIYRALQLLGLQQPTPVQQQVIPQVLQKRDVIAQAQTGSGKTAAYAIPLCQLVDWEENKPQVMILTPTRELAMQVQQEILDIGKLKRIKAPALYGKHSFRQQEKDLKQKSHMVVGTPGRVLDHLERGTLFTGYIGYLVIDEADEMFHMGFWSRWSKFCLTCRKIG